MAMTFDESSDSGRLKATIVLNYINLFNLLLFLQRISLQPNHLRFAEFLFIVRLTPDMTILSGYAAPVDQLHVPRQS